MAQYTTADLDRLRQQIQRAGRKIGKPIGALTAHTKAIELLNTVAKPEK